MERARVLWSAIAPIIATVLFAVPAYSGEFPKIEDGNYGRLNEFRHWTIALTSPEWSQTFRFSLELKPDGLRVYDMQNGFIAGDSERYKADFVMAVYRVSESALRFTMPIPRHPRPPLGSSVQALAQAVKIELISRDGSVTARALPADEKLCPECVSWEVTEQKHAQ